MRTGDLLLWMMLHVVSAMDKQEFIDLTTPVKNMGEGCGYERCPPVRADALNVHMVPHTHGELGYDKMFEDHYTGENEYKFRTSPVSMKRILDAVVTELWEHEHRTFTFTDLPFFFHWWNKRDPTVRRMVYTLVRQGRFNFAGGSWSMSDEATTNYQMLIDSHTYGLRKLNATFTKCGRPLMAWQAHAFGHSKEFASLIALMGYDALFINPISFDDELNRMGNASLEFIWRGNDDLGIETDIFTHSLFDGFDSPPGFCFSSLCSDALVVVSDQAFTNVAERVSSFLTATVHRQSPYYRTQHIMVMMGGSRMYHDAQMWYRNIERLIEFTNTQAAEKSLAVRTFFSSPACYLKAVHASSPILPIKQDDFLPYRADNASYATGMYTSRPTIKYMVAEANRFMQIAKQLQVLGRLGNNDKTFEELNWILGVMQDHNIITGASSQYVTDRYNHKLYLAVQRSTLVLKEAINSIRGSSNTIIYYRCDFNISSCHNAYIQSFYIIVYNPLAWPVTMPIRLPVRAGQKLTITDPKGKEIPSYLMKIPDPVQNIPGRYRAATEEVVFLAEKLPPLGFRSYYFDSERIKVKTKRSIVDYPKDEGEHGNLDLETVQRNRREEDGTNNENKDSVIKTQDVISTTETSRSKEVLNNDLGEGQTKKEFLIYYPDDIESTTTNMDRNKKSFDKYQEKETFYLDQTDLNHISVTENNPKNDYFYKKPESEDDNDKINFEIQTAKEDADEKSKYKNRNQETNKNQSKFSELRAMYAQKRPVNVQIQTQSYNLQKIIPKENNKYKNEINMEFKENKLPNQDSKTTIIRKDNNEPGYTELNKNKNLLQLNTMQNFDFNKKITKASMDGIQDKNELEKENCKTTPQFLNQSEKIFKANSFRNNCIEKPQADSNNTHINNTIGLQHLNLRKKYKNTENQLNKNIIKIKTNKSLNSPSLVNETSFINYSYNNEISTEQVTIYQPKISHQNNLTLHHISDDKPDKKNSKGDSFKVIGLNKTKNNTHRTDMAFHESLIIPNHEHLLSEEEISKMSKNIDIASLSQEKVTENDQSYTKNVRAVYDNQLLGEHETIKDLAEEPYKKTNKNLYYSQTNKPLFKSYLDPQNDKEKSNKIINHRNRPIEENYYGKNGTSINHINKIKPIQSDENELIDSSYEVTDRNAVRRTDTDTEEIMFSIESTKQESYSENSLSDTTKHLGNRQEMVSKSNITQNILSKYITNQKIENKQPLNNYNQNHDQNKSQDIENILKINKEHIPQVNNANGVKEKYNSQSQVNSNSISVTAENKITNKLATNHSTSKKSEKLTKQKQKFNKKRDKVGVFCDVLRKQAKFSGPPKDNFQYTYLYDILCSNSPQNHDESTTTNDKTNQKIEELLIKNNTHNKQNKSQQVENILIIKRELTSRMNNGSEIEGKEKEYENLIHSEVNENLNEKLNSEITEENKENEEEFCNVLRKQNNQTAPEKLNSRYAHIYDSLCQKNTNNLFKSMKQNDMIKTEAINDSVVQSKTYMIKIDETNDNVLESKRSFIKSNENIGNKNQEEYIDEDLENILNEYLNKLYSPIENKNKTGEKPVKIILKQNNRTNEINKGQTNKTNNTTINETYNRNSNKTDKSKSNETSISKDIESENIKINKTDIKLNETDSSKVNEKNNVTTEKPDSGGDLSSSIENINYKFKNVEEEMQWYKNLLKDPDLKYDAHEYERSPFYQKQRPKDYKKPVVKIRPYQEKIPERLMFETPNIDDNHVDLPSSDTKLNHNRKYKTSINNLNGSKQIAAYDIEGPYRKKYIEQSNLDNRSKSQSNLSQYHTIFKRGDVWDDDPYLRKLAHLPTRRPNSESMEVLDEDDEAETEKPKWDPKLVPGYYLREEKLRKGVPVRTTTTEKPKQLLPTPTTTKKPVQRTTTRKKIKYSHRKAQLLPLRTTETPSAVNAPKRLPPLIMHKPNPTRISKFGANAQSIIKPTRITQKEFPTDTDEETPSEIDIYTHSDDNVEPIVTTPEKKVNIKKSKTKTQKQTPSERRTMVKAEFKESPQTFIENQYLRVSMDPRSRQVAHMNLSNGLQISLNIELHFYEADDPLNTGRDGVRPPGAHIFRTLLNEPKRILDKFTSRVYTNPLVQEMHITYSEWASLALRVYNSSPVVEVDWVVGPVPLMEDIGREVFIRYKTSLVNNGVFYTDANGRQMIKRIRNKRPAYETDNMDNVAGNIYPVTSKITIRDTHKNMRFAVFNDRSQGGTSLNDGEIDLFLHRRILTVDDDVGNAVLNETHNDEPITVRGTHYLYLTKANYKPNKLFEKKFAKEIALQPQVLVSGRVPGNRILWHSFNNEFKGIRNKVPFGIHILTLEKLSPGTLLIRLENYLQKSEMISAKPKRVYLKKLLTNIIIISIRETTLAANQFLNEAWTPLQWKRETQFLANFNSFYGTGETEYNDEEELRPLEDDNEMLKEGVWLEPQQIRSFIAQYEYDIGE